MSDIHREPETTEEKLAAALAQLEWKQSEIERLRGALELVRDDSSAIQEDLPALRREIEELISQRDSLRARLRGVVEELAKMASLERNNWLMSMAEMAEQLLKKAGYTRNEDGEWVPETGDVE